MTRLRENVYGHLKRLQWIQSRLQPSDRILEFGCGTGHMITQQLMESGLDVHGIDLDQSSIDYGRSMFATCGLDAERLLCSDLRDLNDRFDVIIASEVLEHIPTEHLGHVLALLGDRLSPDGLLLVTVPNGYGWFELESLLWNRLGLGWLLEKLQVVRLCFGLRRRLLGKDVEAVHPSSLSSSPHVQRFTKRSICDVLHQAGFVVESVRGTVLFAGPISNMIWTGVTPIMNLNNRLGDRWPNIAAGFLVTARRPDA